MSQFLPLDKSRLEYVIFLIHLCCRLTFSNYRTNCTLNIITLRVGCIGTCTYCNNKNECVLVAVRCAHPSV
jgi:hypothetical protein